jgi:ribosomal protein S18 acetylase RimI-like enzyme
MITYSTNKATEEEIKNFFYETSDMFDPALAFCIDIESYAKKIRNYAFTGEVWSNGTLIGLAACYLNNTETLEGFISHFSVSLPFQKRGIASHLLSIIVDKAKKLKFHQIKLEVVKKNENAILFYQNHCFKIVGSFGDKHIMIKKL